MSTISNPRISWRSPSSRRQWRAFRSQALIGFRDRKECDPAFGGSGIPNRGRNMPSLGDTAKKQRIKYFLISFLDLFGTMRAKIVPAGAIDAVAKSGAGFAGFATWFDMTPADPDILAMPDPDSLIQLPWKPEVAWVAADLVMGGKEVAQNPRQVLKRVVATAAKEGYELKSGVECEYFMITPDGKSISDAADQQPKPCYDQQALMRRYDVVAEICDSMTAIG